MKIKIYFIILLILLVQPMTSADILSINSGGNNEIVISDKYIEGFFFDTDIDNPIIQLISPEQGTQDTDGVIPFKFIPSDRYNITYCSLYYQNGLYTISTNIANNQTNIIEVVGVDENHPLYSDDLQWYITCIDEYFNIGVSETRHLDTKDITGGEGITQEIIPKADLNPKYINLLYQKTWIIGENIIEIEAFNQENKSYKPKNITFEFDIDGIKLENLNIANKTKAVFIVDENIKKGNYKIKIIVEDERTLEQEIEFKIGEGIIKIIEDNKILNYIKYGSTIFLFLVLLVLALISDKFKEIFKSKSIAIMITISFLILLSSTIISIIFGNIWYIIGLIIFLVLLVLSLMADKMRKKNEN